MRFSPVLSHSPYYFSALTSHSLVRLSRAFAHSPYHPLHAFTHTHSAGICPQGYCAGPPGRPAEALAWVPDPAAIPPLCGVHHTEAHSLTRFSASCLTLRAHTTLIRARFPHPFSPSLQAYVRKATALDHLGRPAEALAALDKAAKMCSNQPEALKDSGFVGLRDKLQVCVPLSLLYTCVVGCVQRVA